MKERVSERRSGSGCKKEGNRCGGDGSRGRDKGERKGLEDGTRSDHSSMLFSTPFLFDAVY